MATIYPDGKSFNFTFLSKILGLDVIDKKGNFVGKVFDILATSVEVYPKAAELVIKRGFLNSKFANVAWVAVVEMNNQVRLNVSERELKFGRLKDPRIEISLRRDLLDQQVVDTFNRRVVRVNDLHILKVGLDIMVAHIDIGMRGLIRRLGFNRLADFFLGLIAPRSSYFKKENFISWKYVQVIAVSKASPSVKVSMPYNQISNIHPVELGEIIVDLGPEQKMALFKGLDPETRARVFSDLDPETQKFLVTGLELHENAQFIALLPSDEAADFLDLIPKEMVDQLFNLMDAGRAKKLSTLLGYASDTAGGLMTTEYIAVPQTLSVRDVLARIRESNLKSEMIYYVYILDEHARLIGSTTLKRLIAADPDDNIQIVSFPKTATVHLDDDVKEVAYLIEKYRLYALPVVDQNHMLQGIITVDDILEHLLPLIWRKENPR
jgi:CBS domain-containing protein